MAWYLLVESRRCSTRVRQGCDAGLKASKPNKAKFSNSVGTTTMNCSTRVSSYQRRTM